MCEKPDLIDNEGDRWRWEPEYQGYGWQHLSGWSRERIERSYGPVHEAGPVRKDGATPDVRLLLAEALEDVARKLREGS